MRNGVSFASELEARVGEIRAMEHSSKLRMRHIVAIKDFEKEIEAKLDNNTTND